MTAPKGGPNVRAVKRALGALRRHERLYDMSAAVATLAPSTARMVDDVIADPAVAQYAKAKTSVCHLSVLTHLAKMVGTEPTEDAFSQLHAELSERVSPRTIRGGRAHS